MSLPPPDRIILAADIGGTNLNLALVAERAGRLHLLRAWNGSTRAEGSLEEPVLRFLQDSAAAGCSAQPEFACISGAGPVRGRRIPLTNAPWDIDGDQLALALGIPVYLVNDFTAVSYGVLHLDPGDPAELLPLPHPGGLLPQPDPAGTTLIVGAGTGLGVGYVTREGGLPRAHPSEGGHIGLPVLGEDSLDLWRYLAEATQGPPDAEYAVSGPGIATLLGFFLDTGRAERTPVTQAVLALPRTEQPQAIARHGDDDPACGKAMDLFVDLYARVCADLCAVFLPSGGLYLAGGIAAKNSRRFLNNDRFIKTFEHNGREHINALTRATPVFVVQDYRISLFGAARAGLLAHAASAL